MADKPEYHVNLPQTDFPMRAGLPTQEPKWLTRWEEEGIYQKMMQRPAQKGRFLLHCGPPYANGNLHVGHMLSYVLKDFIVRSKAMAGYQTPFVPGWDCHGLPIEWKVEQNLQAAGKTKHDVSVPALRDMCRKEADKWIAIQKEEWKRFGVLADLDNPYLTKDQQNEAGIVRALGALVGKGAVYRGVKSVNWATVENTALAEAEIEYAEHTSTAIYVAFPVKGATDEFVVIWTTTPWTMPANRAVAYKADENYTTLTFQPHEDHAPYINEHYTGKKFWVAEALVESIVKTLGVIAYETGPSQKGKAFKGVTLCHPFLEREGPMLPADHVTTDSGTGFVHTAPAHGAEDFEVGKIFDLDLSCPVAGDGTYEPFVDEDASEGGLKLAGKDIWKAQEEIIAYMRTKGVLLKAYKYKHSYPMSWRSKTPLIFRTTPQWFLELDKSGIRQKALAAIDAIQERGGWIPQSGYKRIRSMIEARPDWCLSRQRHWGVPITIFTDKTTKTPLLDEAAFEVVAQKIEKYGIDAWEKMTPAELLEGYAYSGDITNLEKETDILDVWFDSGTSWFHVLARRDDLKGGSGEDPSTPADLYLEGSDQHRGWFHTSMLTAAGILGHAPYRAVLTHGFVVDGDGRKMSKSVGNVVAPQELIEKYGMDIARLWVASADYREDVRLSDEIIRSMTDSYRRLRNTFRFLLGNLADFHAEKDAVAYADLPALERWVLSRWMTYTKELNAAYNAYEFHKVYQKLHHFCGTELSNLYFDIRKDALYCDSPQSHRRRSCQTVLAVLLKGLATHLAPLLPFTAEEVWRTAFGQAAESVHLQTFYTGEEVWYAPELEEVWQHVWALRQEVNKAVEPLREEGKVKTNATVEAAITVPEVVYDAIKDVDLSEILMTAANAVEKGTDWAVAITLTQNAKCPRCWQHTPTVGTDPSAPELCGRCAKAETQQAGAAA